MYEGKEVTIFAAFANDQLIANYRGIPWKKDPKCQDIVRDDMRRLFGLISGTSIILGRRTYEEIAAFESDPITNAWNAQVVVMSRDLKYQASHDNVLVVNSLDEALEKSENVKISILGGAEVYQAALDQDELVDLLNFTIINKDYNPKGGVFFPEYDKELWQTRSFLKKKSLRGVEFTFTTFERGDEFALW